MFFILSKIFFYLLMPISFLFYGLVMAVSTQSPRRRKRAVIATLIGLYVMSNGFFVNQVLRMWEYAPRTMGPQEKYDLAVVLTGGIADKKGDQMFFGNSADRILQPLFLYKEGKVKKILISGGSGSVSAQADSASEGRAAAYLLEVAGVPKADIMLEGTSRNTRENAVNTAKLLRGKEQKIVLVTSAYHMRRAVGCFEKVNLKISPYPTDFYASDKLYTLDQLLVPKEYNLYCLYRVVHEMLGYVVYSVLGYA
ncbi:YdcF family protein [Siphonobacter sp. SORGH_AS_1065]|uniref:YdcF family protein n=1 Tax=Siphonobacter sp. SORGH_AS_1065 TaxID=3041795 RepID=UPI00277EF297|nr:YdcF family protein [Siphonobacter sp. SORGH_AS_1065]MDQ1088320.1 uncharacterized SAM-binding protein YcdF (DUF218 family) [Siphonobacter sp. SORGH_AS_1065]